MLHEGRCVVRLSCVSQACSINVGKLHGQGRVLSVQALACWLQQAGLGTAPGVSNM